MITLAPAQSSAAHVLPSSASAAEKAAPFIKWVGGKGRLVSQLMSLLPAGIEHRRYFEPFAGGAALFFALRPQQAWLSDNNPALIHTYKAVRDRVDDVASYLELHAQHHCAEYYYAKRDDYNHRSKAGTTEHAALFIYLNKTCFNGLHRVNARGHFNVPMGRYVRPRIINFEALRSTSMALKKVNLRCAQFDELVDIARPGDFVYFDPPYHPLSATANFTSYTQDKFTTDDQRHLRDVFFALDRRGCKVMLSNSDSPLIRELYAPWHLTAVNASRAVNCNARKRGKVSELVVRNYS